MRPETMVRALGAFISIALATSRPYDRLTRLYRGLGKKTDYTVLEELWHDPNSFT